MAHSFQAVRDLFEQALDIPQTERNDWLSHTANGDAELIAEVQRLLALDARTAPALDTPPAVPILPVDPGSPWLGRTIGSFRLMAVLGRGGMGTVFEAEQERPHRRVALKVMRQSISDEKSRVRFEYEAEILARLQHPGIAQVYEAATFEDQGIPQPYFAMELIDGGRPLDAYARDRKLDCRSILMLVEKVCAAVHHGHQRGVVHRDLKPANVIVDATGQPKLIDFGIARAGHTEWQATLSSDSGSTVGTLAYMAPEQLDQGGAAVDTRVDVYALGVILFQLLTGQLPIDLTDLPLGQATDKIRSQEAPRVSLMPVARRLPPDLDWILAKALAKNPDERYASAQALRDDLQRLRTGDPVLAGPPSTTYRLKKFVRKNRVAVFAAAAVVVALVVGTIATSIGWSRALDAEELAENRRRQAEAASVLAEDRRQQAERNADEMWQVAQLQFQLLASARGDQNIRLADVVQEWSDRLPKSGLTDRVAATLHAALGASFYGLGLNDQAFAEYERAWQRIGDNAAEMPRAVRIVRAGLGRVLNGIGKSKEAEPMLREALAELQQAADVSPYEIAVVRTTLGSILLELRNFAEAKEHYELALPALETTFGKEHYSAITARVGLGIALQGLGQNDEARTVYTEACQLAETCLGAHDPETLSARNTFAVFLFHQGDIDAALEQFTALHEASLRVTGAAHPATVRYASNRALCHERKERYAQAEAIYREILAAREAAGTQTELADLIARFNLVVALHRQPDDGKLREALDVVDALIRDAGALLPEDNWRLAVFRQHRGMVLRKLGRYADAEAILAVARDVLEQQLGVTDGRTTSNYAEMIALYEAWGKPEQAEVWRGRLPNKQ